MLLKLQTSGDTSDTISLKVFDHLKNELHNPPILPSFTESQLVPSLPSHAAGNATIIAVILSLGSWLTILFLASITQLSLSTLKAMLESKRNLAELLIATLSIVTLYSHASGP